MGERRIGRVSGGPAGGSDKGSNEYRIEGEAAYLTLNGRNGAIRGYAIIDAEDLPRVLEGGKWSMLLRGEYTSYVCRQSPDHEARRLVLLHRFLLAPDDAFDVDHVNHDGLDNRKHNLRVCSRSKNQQNMLPQKTSKTGFKGVSLNRTGRSYRARIKKEGKEYHLGSFLRPEDAARAYDAAAREMFGDFALPNFPETDTQ